jgi:hypothetical protein
LRAADACRRRSPDAARQNILSIIAAAPARYRPMIITEFHVTTPPFAHASNTFYARLCLR